MNIKLSKYEKNLTNYDNSFFKEKIDNYDEIIVSMNKKDDRTYMNLFNKTIYLEDRDILNSNVIAHEMLHYLLFKNDPIKMSLGTLCLDYGFKNCAKIFIIINDDEDILQNLLEHYLLIETFKKMGYKSEEFTEVDALDLCFYDGIIDGYETAYERGSRKQFELYWNLFLMFFDVTITEYWKDRLIEIYRKKLPKNIFQIYYDYYQGITELRGKFDFNDKECFYRYHNLMNSFIIQLEDYLVRMGGFKD